MAKFSFDQSLMDWILGKDEFEFEWDAGNRTKSRDKHNVTCEEVESVFETTDRIIALGVQVSPEVTEKRFGLFGMTSNRRSLLLSFIIKDEKIRVISARELNRKEQAIYDKLCKE